MANIFDNCRDRRDGESVKWNVYEKDVLPMWVADMDVRSPQAVIDALHARVEHGVFGYPLPPKALSEAIMQRMEERYQWKIKPEDILYLPGVVAGFNLAVQAFTDRGNSLIMQTPVYPPFLCAPENAQVRGIQVDLQRAPDGTYSIDFDAFEVAIAEDTQTFLLCNPHNPVGKVFTKSELERLGEICLRHGVIIVADEIHSDLIFSGHRHTPIASLSHELADQTVTIIAPSKTFNIAGLDCAAIICTNPELREQLERARRGTLGQVNILGYTAALAAYRYGQAWLDELLIALEANRDFLFDSIRQRLPGVSMAKPEGTYLAWLDFRNLQLPQDPYHFFLDQAKVAFNDGREFGKAGEGFLRLNFGCSTGLLEETLVRMESALNKI